MPHANTVAAVVVAGGMGQRMKSVVPKQFLPLKGKPVVQWSLECFERTPEINQIILVLPEDWIDEGRNRLVSFNSRKFFKIVAGGVFRQDSVMAGVNAIEDNDGWVAVHDGARPGITPALVSNAVNQAFALGNAVCAMPSHDTLVRIINGEIVGQIDRNEVYRVQTPQIFKIDVLRQALANAGKIGLRATDEAGLVRELGYRINLVEGSEMSAKITTSEDLVMLESIL